MSSAQAKSEGGESQEDSGSQNSSFVDESSRDLGTDSQVSVASADEPVSSERINIDASEGSSTNTDDTKGQRSFITLLNSTQVDGVESLNQAQEDIDCDIQRSSGAIDGTLDCVKQHQCEPCGKGFTTLRSLRRHERRVHRGERPLQCQQCGKRFFAQSELVSHSRVHSGERPFVCPECGRAFKEDGALVDHQRRYHSNERPFQCLFCSESFASNSSWRHHEKRKHPGMRAAGVSDKSESDYTSTSE